MPGCNEFRVFVDVVLIGIVVLSALLCAACVCVFVRQFIRWIGILAPLNRYSTCFDEYVALAPIALHKYRHKGGVIDFDRFRAQCPIRPVPDLVDQTRPPSVRVP